MLLYVMHVRHNICYYVMHVRHNICHCMSCMYFIIYVIACYNMSLYVIHVCQYICHCMSCMYVIIYGIHIYSIYEYLREDIPDSDTSIYHSQGSIGDIQISFLMIVQGY